MNAQDKGGLIPLHNAASYGVNISNFLRLYLFLKIVHFINSILSLCRMLLLLSYSVILFVRYRMNNSITAYVTGEDFYKFVK